MLTRYNEGLPIKRIIPNRLNILLVASDSLNIAGLTHITVEVSNSQH